MPCDGLPPLNNWLEDLAVLVLVKRLRASGGACSVPIALCGPWQKPQFKSSRPCWMVVIGAHLSDRGTGGEMKRANEARTISTQTLSGLVNRVPAIPENPPPF